MIVRIVTSARCAAMPGARCAGEMNPAAGNKGAKRVLKDEPDKAHKLIAAGDLSLLSGVTQQS
jgi:hypothetical protein